MVIGQITALVLFGIVAFAPPLWILATSIRTAAQKAPLVEPSSRYFAYSKILGFVHEAMKSGKVECGPLWIVAIRELRTYSEYKDITLLYLEEVNITGENKFDRVMERELKDVEAFLLERTND